MKTVELVFTKSKKCIPIASWLIRLWTNKPYSHCARGFIAKNDIKMYYQASEGMVNYENKRAFNQKHVIVKSYKIEVSNAAYDKIVRGCLLDAGVKYGTLQNLGIIIVDILELLGKRIDNPFKKGKNCSELMYENVFKELIPELPYNQDTIKPHQIEDIILKYFKSEKEIWKIKKPE